MISDQRKLEIIRVFQANIKRDNSQEIEALSLQELKDTDVLLADRDLNAGFRIALRNRSKELEGKEEQKRESHIRVVGYIVSFCLGVLATLLAVWLT